jgi:hypothetical protein
MLCRNLGAGRRRPAEVERRIRRLDWGKEELSLFDPEMRVGLGHFLALHQLAPNRKEFVRNGVALIVIQEHAVAPQFERIAARDHVDEHTSAGKTIERRSHSCRERGLGETRADGDEKPQPLRERRHCRGDDPRILARTPSRQKNAVIAELIGGARDLREIAERDVPRADLASQVPPVAMGRQKPQNIGLFGRRWRVDHRGHCSSLELGERKVERAPSPSRDKRKPTVARADFDMLHAANDDRILLLRARG